MLMTIILWVIFGAIVGFIADYIDKSVTLSWMERILVGIVGAVVGGTVAHLVTTGSFDLAASASFDLVSFIVAILGALGALFVWKRFRKPSVA